MSSFTHFATSCPYLEQVHGALPRILGSIDLGEVSRTHGLADRRRWAWRVSDFSDATWQSSAVGLAVLVSSRLLPDWLPEHAAVDATTSLVDGLRRLIRRDGSLEEAFPRERSWCVTALGALTLGEVMARLDDRISDETRRAWTVDLDRMTRFLVSGDESHGVISNHRATVAAALMHGAEIGDAGPARARHLLESLLEAEGNRGWWPEYGGFDPAYQTLCMHYLSLAHQRLSDSDPLKADLKDAMSRGFETLAWFMHGDGSFGGAYGRRGGRFLVPSAAEVFARDDPAAAAFAGNTRSAIQRRRVVTLEAVADANAPILLTAYCIAAAKFADSVAGKDAEISAPSGERVVDSVFVRREGSSGVVVDLTDGTVCNFDRTGCVWTGPPAAQNAQGAMLAASKDQPGGWSREGDDLLLDVQLVDFDRRLPGSVSLALLRILGATLFASPVLARLCKNWIVRLAFTSTGRTRAGWMRRINGLSGRVEDSRIDLPDGFEVVDSGKETLQPTASRGYWSRSETLH
jgi:hypothetical protein